MPESELFKEIASLATELVNEETRMIDTMMPGEILQLINKQDALVAEAVSKVIPEIEIAVTHIVDSFRAGGRLFYFGAGTSGRLGIVDASECPPTFGTSPGMVQGIIAGGREAVFQAQEGAEDKPENGANEIINRNILPPDIVCGIAASGRTPFVRGALDEAGKRNIYTILITTVPKEQALKNGMTADCMICPVTGPEVIAGSTRMKSGTAQKLVLNMLTTSSMIMLGKTYGNVMVDLQLTNEKLKERAKRIIMDLTGISYDEAALILDKCKGHIKTALVAILAGVEPEQARKLISDSNGFVRKAIELS
jgi:N-acetylmuramic acid 6-phosphate etherase